MVLIRRVLPIAVATAASMAILAAFVGWEPTHIGAGHAVGADPSGVGANASPEQVPGATESPGPWGILQSYYVYIAAPDSILRNFDVPSAVTKWTFFGMNRAAVASLFDDPAIPGAVRSELQDQSRWTAVDDQIQVVPSVTSVLALPPEARARIYRVLSQWETNEFIHSPYFVPGGDVQSWIGDAGLRPEVLDAVKRTTYPVGKSLCFSDLPLIVSMSRSHGESRDMIKVLSRSRTAILRLRLDGASDVPKIREYWSSGAANAKDFLPLLESIVTNPSVRHLDVVHILPPYARKLCYTYPHPSLAVGGRYPDCHWTCLNFFNYRPEDRLFDTEGASLFVQEHYDVGALPYRFGDILFLTDSAGRAIHSCVYLADDFVFTKNGANVVSPWLIMKLAEVSDRYSVQGEPQIRIYRRRP